MKSLFENLEPETTSKREQSPFALGTELFLALDSFGISALSDDDCCRLLAWMYHDRGSNEAPVQNWALGRDIKVAQQRLNIYGGQIPNGELIGRFQEFCQELEQPGDKPEWFIDIERKYKVNPEK